MGQYPIHRCNESSPVKAARRTATRSEEVTAVTVYGHLIVSKRRRGVIAMSLHRDDAASLSSQVTVPQIGRGSCRESLWLAVAGSPLRATESRAAARRS